MAYGWQAAFTLIGLLGFLWLAAWWSFYKAPESHPLVNSAELATIRSGPAETAGKIAWCSLWPHQQTWAFALGKFLTDPIW